MIELADGAMDDPAAAAALARGAAWLRAHQNADGSFGAAPAESAASAWNPWRRRMSRQAGLDTGGDRSLRGDDLVYFLFRADIDEGDAL